MAAPPAPAVAFLTTAPAPTTALLALVLPLLAYVAYALHALLAAHRASTDALLRELRSSAAATATKPSPTPSTDAGTIAQDLARATAAVEKVVAAVESWQQRWRDEHDHHDQHHARNGAAARTYNNGPSSFERNGGGGRGGGGFHHARNDSVGSARSVSYRQQDEDADLYRRKVEAMEGLRRLMEAQPAPLVEDADLYRRRVEALEGLRRVLEMQPGVGLGGRGAVPLTPVEGRKKVAGRGAAGGGPGTKFGAALSVRSEGRALKKERSAETLGESLLDL